MHEVVALHGRTGKPGEPDRARVVDDDVDTAEPLDGLGDGRLHFAFFAHVDLERQRLAAGGFDFFGRRIDGAGQFRVGDFRLRRDNDVGAVARSPAWQWRDRYRAKRR